jgi:DNA-binding transcriptional LysR family regulator
MTSEILFTNERVVFGRRDHPLGQAKSLMDLTRASSIATSMAHDHQAGFQSAFEEHNIAPPKVAIEAPSALSAIVIASNSNLLAMLPRQWQTHPWTVGLLQRIEVKEHIKAPPICMVYRAGIPLTPAAEHFSDLLRRAAVRESL